MRTSSTAEVIVLIFFNVNAGDMAALSLFHLSPVVFMRPRSFTSRLAARSCISPRSSKWWASEMVIRLIRSGSSTNRIGSEQSYIMEHLEYKNWFHLVIF